jgi:hypothetical protein
MKFTIDYSISGAIEFEAETAAEAQAKFEDFSIRELAELGTLEQNTDPMTEAEIEALMRKYGIGEVSGSGASNAKSAGTGRELVGGLEKQE